LTLQEAAERLRCSTKTVRRYVASGRLPAYRVGPTMLRVSAEQLDAMGCRGRCRPSGRLEHLGLLPYSIRTREVDRDDDHKRPPPTSAPSSTGPSLRGAVT
jgi:excisionase family DNA binding protein